MSKILLVNDNPYELMKLEYQLVSLSVSNLILALTDPVEAMMRLRNEQFDMLFVNYRMSVIDGLSLIRTAHKDCPKTFAIILASAADAVYIKSQAIYKDCDHLLLKPCSIDDLKYVLGQDAAQDYHSKDSDDKPAASLAVSGENPRPQLRQLSNHQAGN